MAQDLNKHPKMPKVYEAKNVEPKWYKFWQEEGYFKPKIDLRKKPFVIIMPPPNVTGELHLGHALTATLEDIMTRWHRMKGDPTLWLPGVDHAGIATQVVVEKMLVSEGIDRHKLGRKKTEARIRQWAESRRRIIAEQHQRLGVSCDWSRERYTLDEGPSRAVRTAFVRLYNKGLIYRGERIINWCPRCATALSDLEVDHKDVQGHLYYVCYHLTENDIDFITVATTRPETILGDTAVAVNPRDKRFKSMVGKKVNLPAVNRIIPIIADNAVDPHFGTGAVKVTPGHDPVDFDIARRAGLPLVNILNPDATMNENSGPFAGIDRFSCRKEILNFLEKEGLLVKVEDYSHAVGHCQRCQTIIEPIASKQWFVKMQPLARPAIDKVIDGNIIIVPKRFCKVYLNWLENIRDWCISRQLWWGHRIPVWYCHDCGELTVSEMDVDICCQCGSKKVEQDPDVLDTWFSSALWTHSTLGWPKNSDDLRYFYPTTVMETGYDILFFWVARMIMMGLEDTGDIPFKVVYLHGLIRDEHGEKMSKIRGNVLNPIIMLENYGTDALRFALSTGTAPGNDIKLTPSKLEAGRNFSNKLWNATRFVIRNISQSKDISKKLDMKNLEKHPPEDRWILNRLRHTITGVNNLLTEFQFGEAEHKIYEFLWSEFCDWYIELAKIRLRNGAEVISPIPVLTYVLETSLRLLHPYMPFITEELWQNLKQHLPRRWGSIESIMIAPYPDESEIVTDLESERITLALIEIVRSIRNTRAHYDVENTHWIEIQIYAGELHKVVAKYEQAIQTMVRAKPITFFTGKYEKKPSEKEVVLVLKELDVVIPMESMVDLSTERERLKKLLERDQFQIERLEIRLKDKEFLVKAPKTVIERERNRLEVLMDKVGRTKRHLSSILD